MFQNAPNGFLSMVAAALPNGRLASLIRSILRSSGIGLLCADAYLHSIGAWHYAKYSRSHCAVGSW
jgi:hypothetical protein